MNTQLVDSSVLALAECFLHDNRDKTQIQALTTEQWGRLARVIAADIHTAISDAIDDPELALVGTAAADMPPEPEAA